MALFIQEALGRTPLEQPILAETFEETMDSFISYAERKMKGYSVKEIDVLAKAAKAVNSEVSKRSALERIDGALKDAKSSLRSATNADKQKELRTQIQVLSELRSKVSSFSVVTKPDEEKETSEKEKIDLDNR